MIKVIKDKDMYVVYYTYTLAHDVIDRLTDKIYRLKTGADNRTYWWRATDNKTEDDICSAIRSRNHATGIPEKGISVSESIGYHQIYGYTYIYPITGDVIGKGSDGEPLLANAKALAKPARKPSKKYLNKEKNLLSVELQQLYCALRDRKNIKMINEDYNKSNNVLLEV